MLKFEIDNCVQPSDVDLVPDVFKIPNIFFEYDVQSFCGKVSKSYQGQHSSLFRKQSWMFLRCRKLLPSIAAQARLRVAFGVIAFKERAVVYFLCLVSICFGAKGQRSPFEPHFNEC